MKKEPPIFTSTRDKLLYRIEVFLDKRPYLTEAQFGKEAIGDTQLVNRLRAGKDITTRNLDAINKVLDQPIGEDHGKGKEGKTA